MTKPKSLKPGARIAIVSPASTPKPELVSLGLERLRCLGYEPVVFPNALAAGPLYYAGTAQQRVADLHAAFADASIDAIFCVRGGWGAAELLPLLDAELIRANPKPFLGFSDHTTLHLYLAQTCGMATFYAPMLSSDFARGERLEDGVDLRSFRASLTQARPWNFGPREGLRLLKSAGAPRLASETWDWTGTKVQGTLFGGCLTLLIESLGTPWALQPPPGDSILFLEEVGTKPYQWDRMLLHLQYAGILDRVRAIVFGDMEQCLTATDPEARAHENILLEQALRHRLSDFKGPVAIGLQSGHVNTPNLTLPLNIQAELDLSTEPTLRLLEAAVTL